MTYFLTTTNGNRVYFSEADMFTALANTWTETSDGYAKRYYEKNVNGVRKRWVKYFHREVMKPRDGQIIDHINQDKLDNRRDNLRVASKSVNALNSLKSRGAVPYRGVIWSKNHNKYHARIVLNGKQKHLGSFDNPESASLAYNNAQKEVLNNVV